MCQHCWQYTVRGMTRVQRSMSADARSVVQRGGQASYATTKVAVQTPGRVMQVAERGERRVSNGSAGAEVREAVLATLLGFNRQMMARLGGASAMEWPRGVSAGQIKLLFWLTHADEQPMSQIARALGIGTPGATSLVDKLVEHRL